MPLYREPAQAETVTEHVAMEVRALMGRHRVTQMQIAELLGISQASVSMRLRGRTPFDVNEVGALAIFFGVAPAELLPELGQTGHQGGAAVIHA